MKKELMIAAAALVLIGVMNMNEPSKRAFDMQGLLQTWGPLAIGGWILFKLFR